MGIDAGEGVALYAECLRGLVFSPNGLLKLVFDKSNGRFQTGVWQTIRRMLRKCNHALCLGHPRNLG